MNHISHLQGTGRLVFNESRILLKKTLLFRHGEQQNPVLKWVIGVLKGPLCGPNTFLEGWIWGGFPRAGY